MDRRSFPRAAFVSSFNELFPVIDLGPIAMAIFHFTFLSDRSANLLKLRYATEWRSTYAEKTFMTS